MYSDLRARLEVAIDKVMEASLEDTDEEKDDKYSEYESDSEEVRYHQYQGAVVVVIV